MFNSSRGLHAVLLQSNQLSGSLPSTQPNCDYLWVLDLRDNRLSGSFPEQVSCFRNLRALLLSKNSFTGRVPFWIWHLSELHVLDLSHNRFQGSIPANLSGLRAYRDPYTASKPIIEQEAICVSSVLAGKGFDVYHDNIQKATTLFDVSYNMLSGIIPVDLGHFRALNFLFLAHNQVACGPIPPTFSELNFVQVMDLSNNRLTGSIPVALAQLRSLRKFDVGNNLLPGVIPAGGQFATFNAWDYEPGNPELCGFPLPVSRSCPELDILDDEIASQPTDVVFWAAVSIGFAVGYLTVGSLIMAHRRLFDFVTHKGFYNPEPPSYQVSHGQYTSPQ